MVQNQSRKKAGGLLELQLVKVVVLLCKSKVEFIKGFHNLPELLTIHVMKSQKSYILY